MNISSGKVEDTHLKYSTGDIVVCIQQFILHLCFAYDAKIMSESIWKHYILHIQLKYTSELISTSFLLYKPGKEHVITPLWSTWREQ